MMIVWDYIDRCYHGVYESAFKNFDELHLRDGSNVDFKKLLG